MLVHLHVFHFFIDSGARKKKRKKGGFTSLNLRGGAWEGARTRSRADPALGAAQGMAGLGEPRSTGDSTLRAGEARKQPRYARGSE